MKQKKQPQPSRKLVLNRQTLRQLDLAKVTGGALYVSNTSSQITITRTITETAD